MAIKVASLSAVDDDDDASACPIKTITVVASRRLENIIMLRGIDVLWLPYSISVGVGGQLTGDLCNEVTVDVSQDMCECIDIILVNDICAFTTL